MKRDGVLSVCQTLEMMLGTRAGSNSSLKDSDLDEPFVSWSCSLVKESHHHVMWVEPCVFSAGAPPPSLSPCFA